MGSDIEKVILNYLRKELSPGEKDTLEVWKNEDPSHKEELDTLVEIWESQIGYPEIVNMADEQKKVWKRLQNENRITRNAATKKVFGLRAMLRYAAVIIFLAGFGYVFWENSKSDATQLVTVETIEHINPFGQKSKIQLPDGSIVWLNAGSKLTYSNDFNVNNRELYLVGEAYFEVTRNPTLPLRVLTNNLQVTAIGTSFNVCAYEGKQLQKIALNTGEVRVDCRDHLKNPCIGSNLKPGHLASFDKNSMEISVTEFVGTDPFGWKEGNIVFNNATFGEVIETLSRWYNVEFEITGTLNQEWNYSTTFPNETLINVLETLKFSEKIDYELENGSSIVKLKL